MRPESAAKEGPMRTMPAKCRNINSVKAFCECIAEDSSADAAAKAFCQRAAAGDRYVTGDDLAELKKALMDLEDRGDFQA